MTKARKAPGVNGKPAWNGLFERNGKWRKARSAYGPIAYTSPAYALAGAEVCSDNWLTDVREALRVHAGIRVS